MKEPIAYNSGNIRSINETKASIEIGAPIGITVHSQQSIIELAMGYAFVGGKVFVDNGAFTEYSKGTNLDIETLSGRCYWDSVFAVYREIASIPYGADNLVFVAPDQVGNPDVTLKNLEWLMYEVHEIRSTGAQIIQPIQKGKKPDYDISVHIADLSNWYYDFENTILGFPSKREAWHVSEVLDYLMYKTLWEKRLSTTEPVWCIHPDLKIHFLGIGDPLRLSKIQKYIDKIRPNVFVSGDSVPTGGIVGKGRKLTETMNSYLKLHPNLTREERGELRCKILSGIEWTKRQQHTLA